MSDGFLIRLPVPPSVNGLWFNLPRGGRAKTAAYLNWIARADDYFLVQKRSLVPVRGPYVASIKIPADTKGDADGRIKAVLDYLVTRELTDDDRHCASVKVERVEGENLAGVCLVEVRARGEL